MRQLVLFVLALTMCQVASAKDVFVNTPKTTLMLAVNEGQTPRIQYYGSRIKPEQAHEVYDASGLNGDAYPAFGRNSFDETALSVTHADGNMTTELVVTGCQQRGNETIVSLKDKTYDFFVDLYYRADDKSDVIVTWSVIRNGEKKPVKMEQYASGVMTFRQEGAWLTHFHGAWGQEAGMTEEPLTAGLKTIVNHDGVRTAMDDRAEVMISLDGKPQENCGRVVGAALCWTGNYKLRIETRGKNRHILLAGIDDLHTAYTLKSGETFTTPELALTFSNEGKGGVSRAFHRWGRNVQLHNGHVLREIFRAASSDPPPARRFSPLLAKSRAFPRAASHLPNQNRSLPAVPAFLRNSPKVPPVPWMQAIPPSRTSVNAGRWWMPATVTRIAR